MIKLGDSYFDETRIVAISPRLSPGKSEDEYAVYIENSCVFYWKANADEVQRTLEKVGLISQDAGSKNDLALLASCELAELEDAYQDGYRYAAKDEMGFVYAFSEPPRKGALSWVNNDERSKVARLTAGPYSFLSFRDDCPLEIADALGAECN